MITVNSQTSMHEDQVVEEFYEQLERVLKGVSRKTNRNRQEQRRATESNVEIFMNRAQLEELQEPRRNPLQDGTGTADTRRTTTAMPIPTRIREAETSTPNTCGTSTAASCCVVVKFRPCSPKRIQAFVSPRNLSQRTQNNFVLKVVTTLSGSQENKSSPLQSGEKPWFGHVAWHDTIPKTVL